MSAAPPAPKLTLGDINPLTLQAKYAVRGKVPTRAEELKKQLAADPTSVPFKAIINANIGNPQQLDQKPLSFYRRVTSLIQNPDLLDIEAVVAAYPPDTVARARKFLASAKSVGAYSNSQGVESARSSVAEYISKRDGYPASKDDIFLTNGASAAVEYILETCLSGEKSGVLIPIPQYPLYTALISLLGATAMPYYLKEQSGWSIDATEVEKSVVEKLANGVKTKILVLINPGNPTGAILSEEAIGELLTIAAKYGIVVIADEVYQENVYEGKFISTRKVLKNLQAQDPTFYGNVQLASLHSTSKGVSGECGQRAGYMELIGFSDEVRAIFVKMVSINLCSVVTGQAVMEMMVNPPSVGDASYELDQQQRGDIFKALQDRSKYMTDAFNKMNGIECQKAEGAMYLFPRIHLPEKFVAQAQEKGVQPDELYCLELLENTGICTVPGSGFGQVEGTYHCRTTFLPPGVEWINAWEKFHNEFMSEYQ
ncbi:alanine transaminase [Saccharomycopsis crataegensis]|uniref:Alanine transaminase n=1 Tax=Saccharomycopsis crataegensis TaxID=43959 RepID=A0AAV5QD57_9ASCO|nr:alanine transaminase [Saccharomycopsis crataegensis]